eukprot:6573180-Pyramimonas_sp.AAC.1
MVDAKGYRGDALGRVRMMHSDDALGCSCSHQRGVHRHRHAELVDELHTQIQPRVVDEVPEAVARLDTE